MDCNVFCSRKGQNLEDKLNDFFASHSIKLKSLNFSFVKAFERSNYLATVQYEPHNRSVIYKAKVLIWNFNATGRPDDYIQRKIDGETDGRSLDFVKVTESTKGWVVLVVTSVPP